LTPLALASMWTPLLGNGKASTAAAVTHRGLVTITIISRRRACSNKSEISRMGTALRYWPHCLFSLPLSLPPTHFSLSQVGWAYDGFPIYGPKGPGGVTMKYSSAACTAAGTSGCTGTGTYVLDMCGGYEGEISGLDTFKYRYYFTGATSDLSVLPSNPRPSADAAPIFAFSMNCQRGFTSTELQSGSTGTTGVTTSYSAAANAGKAEQYAPTGLCSAGSYTAPGTAGFCDDTTTSSCNAAWTAITTTTSTTSAPTTANLGTRATCSFFLMLVASLAACFF